MMYVKMKQKQSEEHPFLFSVLDKAFGINALNAHKYGACLGHIATYFQNENECPENLCYYSKYIKVGYYGGTTDTLNKSRCGVEGIINVVQTSLTLTADSGLSFFVKVADAFKTLSKKLIKNGYKEGFSLGGLPNDYRRYLATNNFATKVFKSQINRLNKNTEKPVVLLLILMVHY